MEPKIRSTNAAANAVSKLILNAAIVRGEKMICQNRTHVMLMVFNNNVESGISTMRLKYRSVNPIVRPNHGSTERWDRARRSCMIIFPADRSDRKCRHRQSRSVEPSYNHLS